MEYLDTVKKYQRVLYLIDAHNIDREKVEEAFNDYANSLDFGEKERDALREENAALRAAVREMERMLPVLEYFENGEPLENDGDMVWADAVLGTGIATLNTYRQTLLNALAKMEMK